jgi:iron-sulfur cluster repair protein YtfE (RIC family)
MATSSDATETNSRDGLTLLGGCHREILLELDRLATLVAELDGRGPTFGVRSRTRELLTFFTTAARQHNEDEERHVFPAMLRSCDEALIRAIGRMQEDHGWIELAWLEVEPHLRAISDGSSAYNPEQLRAAVEAFTALSRDHISLEERVLYPNARTSMPLVERRHMMREMAARRRRKSTVMAEH